MSHGPDETRRVPGMESDVEPGGDGFDAWPSGAGAAASGEQGEGEREAEGGSSAVVEDDPAVQEAIADDTTTSRFATVDREDAGELAVPFREPEEGEVDGEVDGSDER